MKKLFVLFACVALFAACNSVTTETEVTSTEEVCDSSTIVTETASTETVDVSTDTVEATATK
jgi:uncharacterized lipoprotein YajG